jgi:hypothetical protein
MRPHPIAWLTLSCSSLAACRTAESVSAPDSAAPPAPAVSEPAVVQDEAYWLAQELKGAPYARDTAPALAALAPRELSGNEADERALRAFDALSEKEQRDLLDWFTVECEKLATFQGSLIRYVLEHAPRPAAEWPGLAPLVWYDEHEHSPAHPIPRVPLAAGSPEVAAVRNRILGAPGTRRLDGGWLVDYAARGLVRLPHQDDPRRVFWNGLLGMEPDWDLAEALVELELDDGSLQSGFAAFGHAYSDRWGGVYPGVTLYDAHASLLQIEMPDVDTLGLVHELLGDWQTWAAPVPAEQHEALYARIAELFRPLHRHRGLRTNLARTYLRGNAELRDSYRFNLDNFHALWESVRSDPAALRAKLPDAEGWRDFLQGWDDTLRADPVLFAGGTNRHATLDREAQSVRATLLRVLEEYGALDEIEKLPPFE